MRRLLLVAVAGALTAAISFTAIAQDVDPAIAAMTPAPR